MKLLLLEMRKTAGEAGLGGGENDEFSFGYIKFEASSWESWTVTHTQMHQEFKEEDQGKTLHWK